MSQQYATQEDVERIINHIKNLTILHNLGLYETGSFVHKREEIPLRLV